MGLVQDVEQKVELWALRKALPGAIQAVVAFFVGHLVSGNVTPILTAYGVTIDPTKLGASLTTLGTGAGAAFVTHTVLDWIVHHIFKQPSAPATPPAQ